MVAAEVNSLWKPLNYRSLLQGAQMTTLPQDYLQITIGLHNSKDLPTNFASIGHNASLLLILLLSS
jgi:hypothetical protein